MDQTELTRPPDRSMGEQQQRRNIGRTVAIIAAAVLLVAALAASVYFLATTPGLAAKVRDLAIILLSIVTIVIGLFLAVLVFQLQSLIALLRDEVRPILESANKTASTLRGTTTFVSDAVVNPVIQVASFTAAVRSGLTALLGGSNRRGQASRRHHGHGNPDNSV
jgi:membrane protein implicated in regulation of membrane protease activity